MNLRIQAVAALAAVGIAIAVTAGGRVRGGDPFIHLENGTYYLYCSFRDSEGLVVHTSEDLKEDANGDCPHRPHLICRMQNR